MGVEGTYRNGDGREHPERRETWYTNKDLFEMVQDLKKELGSFNLKVKEYNGLWDKVRSVEERPCRQDTEIKELAGMVKELYQDRVFLEKSKEKLYKKIALAGSLVGLVGGMLGILSMMGVL